MIEYRFALLAVLAAIPATAAGLHAQEVTRLAPLSRPAIPAPTGPAARGRGTLEAAVLPRLRPASRAEAVALRTAAADPELTGADALRLAMQQMRRGSWDAAEATAARAGDVARDVIRWHRLRSGRGDFAQLRDFLDRNPDWPGLPYLRKKSEGTVPLRAEPGTVIAHFSDEPPQTGAGAIALASALTAAGRADEADALLIEAWRDMPLSTGDEALLLERHGRLLSPHHTARLDARLWDGDFEAAERMLPRVPEGWRKLARARMLLRQTAPGVDAAIEAVPDALKSDPGLAFERFNWRARKGRNLDAAAIALAADGTADTLGQPNMWGNWRRVLGRWLMRQGETETAYRLVSEHGLEAGRNFADLEWLAGYLALTYLDDPAAAIRHFEAFRGDVVTPISLGRAGYWLGRAHEAAGDPDAASAAYAFGAEHQTSFYGLLAAERAGLPMDPGLTGRTEYPDWKDTALAASTVVEAARLLDAAGEHQLAERFFAHAAEGRSEAEIGALVDLVLEMDEPHYALMIAKRAAQEGIVIPKGYFPLVDLAVEPMPVPEELALSIARRESEFDPAVRSSAGAMGLMQVMPATAREVAGILEIGYDRSRLLSDPAYNARLGTTYLGELVAVFGDNYVLVSAGYNAGPSRPIRWMSERGDPRDAGVDPVDWIEHIPFDETRNYVMRVMESLPVYRARLSGETAPIRLTDEMKAR